MNKKFWKYLVIFKTRISNSQSSYLMRYLKSQMGMNFRTSKKSAQLFREDVVVQ